VKTVKADDDEQGPGCGTVYFDLGATLVDTSDRTRMTFMPGAADYLTTLRDHGTTVGLITNIPPEWGTTDEERVAALKAFVDGLWVGGQAFPWDDFGELIFTPRTDAESKPAPDLFIRARDAAAGCPVVFEGENPAEVATAEREGFLAYQVFQPDQPAYLPPGQVWAHV